MRARLTRVLGALLLFGSVAALSADTTTYKYDQLGRLVESARSDGVTANYDYDPAGNRKLFEVVGSDNRAPSPSTVIVVGSGALTVVIPLQ